MGFWRSRPNTAVVFRTKDKRCFSRSRAVKLSLREPPGKQTRFANWQTSHLRCRNLDRREISMRGTVYEIGQNPNGCLKGGKTNPLRFENRHEIAPQRLSMCLPVDLDETKMGIKPEASSPPIERSDICLVTVFWNFRWCRSSTARGPGPVRGTNCYPGEIAHKSSCCESGGEELWFEHKRESHSRGRTFNCWEIMPQGWTSRTALDRSQSSAQHRNTHLSFGPLGTRSHWLKTLWLKPFRRLGWRG